jgi:hypothetical protein
MFLPHFDPIPSVFHQSSPNFNGTSYDPLKHSFGLVDSSKERWSRFQTEVDKLNEESDKHTAYKVFFVARHGQGWHNVSLYVLVSASRITRKRLIASEVPFSKT